MSSITGLYSPLPQSISDSDSEREHSDSFHSPLPYEKRNKNYPKRIDNLPEIKISKMSPIRKTCFILSIIMCFLPIIVLLQILPCDIETCPVKISNWETQQEGVEMKGSINLFFERFKKHFNLAVLYKGDTNSAENLKHGVISFLGNNGEVNWYFRQAVVPQRLDCSLIDVDLDGIPDCLLLDEGGMKVVDVISGQTIWHVHSHEEKMLVENLQFPILLTDLNGDGIKELLSMYQRKYLMIICGRSGKALSNILIEQCNDVDNLINTNDYATFSCKNNTELLYYKVKLVEITNKFFDNSHLIQYEKFNYTTPLYDSYNLDNYVLQIRNHGECPDCTSILNLQNEHKLIYSKSYNNSHIFTPAKFKFTSSKFKSLLTKGHTEGYVVKIWDWHERFNPKRSTDYPFNFKRDNSNNTNYGYSITERVLLITFNTTDYNVIQASSTNVTQLCIATFNCQPDVKNQENSLLIWDLDRDGSQELISYTSSFYFRENTKLNDNPWQLISTIKVLKLESELPKLYDTRQSYGMFANY